MAKRPKKTRRKVLSPDERKQRREKRAFSKSIHDFAKGLGFTAVLSDGIEIVVGGRTGEIDNIYIYDNIILLIEWTISKNDGTSHLLKKMPFYNNILSDIPGFLEIARSHYSQLSSALQSKFADQHYKIKILYVPAKESSTELKASCPSITFFEGATRKYFFELCKTLRQSARIEFFSFLDLTFQDVGQGTLGAAAGHLSFGGYLLPESNSSFPKGYKIVSFYADPASLMVGAYVLRRDGWRDSASLYQRILIRSKLHNMRRYLAENQRVFVNNIIVTLCPDTHVNHPTMQGINLTDKELEHAKAVTISVPGRFNTTGIIDGQHRLFSYYQGDDEFEKHIKDLRNRQHLLVTGIIHPKGISEPERMRFEANLFLEINDTQKRAPPSLRQEIETIVRPYSGIAVATRIIASLARTGPFAGQLQTGYFDTASKIKTSSIVSYGLRPLVKFEGSDSLFAAWEHPNKEKLRIASGRSKASVSSEASELLDLYVKFCTENLSSFLTQVKLSVGTHNWNMDLPNRNALLRPTSINGLIACLRLIILNRMSLRFELQSQKKRIANFKDFPFEDYKSSRWNALGEALFKLYKK